MSPQSIRADLEKHANNDIQNRKCNHNTTKNHSFVLRKIRAISERHYCDERGHADQNDLQKPKEGPIKMARFGTHNRKGDETNR